MKGKIIATNSRTANRRYTNIRYVLLCSPSVRQILPIITALFLCKTVQKPFLCGLIITHFCFCHYFFWSLTFVTAHTSFHVYLFHVYLFLLYVFPPNSEQETTVFLGLEQKFLMIFSRRFVLFFEWRVRPPIMSRSSLFRNSISAPFFAISSSLFAEFIGSLRYLDFKEMNDRDFFLSSLPLFLSL